MTAKIGLVEVFNAPQGEGYNAGRWATFVRFAGCQLACEFAPGVVCDTPYQEAKLKVTIDELFEELIPMNDRMQWEYDNMRMLVFTGGEPTIQPQFAEIVTRALHLMPKWYLAVETNGITWHPALAMMNWISVSPKVDVPQTSQAPQHNPHPGKHPQLSAAVQMELTARAAMRYRTTTGGEYRYVITASSPHPPYNHAARHYLSPAVKSDGSGEEWKRGFPGFAPGAVERCLEIIACDPRWRISTQQHKIWGVR